MNSLQDKLIELWDRQHPFVSFRVPNSEEVIIYYQIENTLYSTNKAVPIRIIIYK